MTVGIVGAGIAGLAAGYRLQSHGYDVQLYDTRPQVGGLAASYETAGDPIEQFYHHLSASEQTIVELAEELGLGDAVEWRYKSDAYYVDGVVHPMDTIFQIAAYPHLSIYDKFRLGMLTKEIDVRGGIPEFDAYGDLTEYEDVPIEQFLLEHTTRSVYENFWAPLLDAKFGSRTEDVSAAWLLGRIKFRGERDLLRGEQLGYMEGGFHRLLEALVEAVGREHVATGTRVTGLEFGEDGAVERLRAERVDDAGADGGSATASTDGEEGGARIDQPVEGVVVAAMPNVLEALTGYECEITFQGTVCSVVSTPEPIMDGTYWLNIADEAPFGALIEHTNFVPAERYGGEHLTYVASYVQDPAEELWQLDDGAVEALWLDGIADLFPEFDPDDPDAVNWVKTARNPRTAPVYERGYLDMVVPYDLGTEVGEGIYYAGMASRAQYPERSLDGGVEAGYAAADSLAGVDSEYLERTFG